MSDLASRSAGMEYGCRREPVSMVYLVMQSDGDRGHEEPVKAFTDREEANTYKREHGGGDVLAMPVFLTAKGARAFTQAKARAEALAKLTDLDKFALGLMA